MSDENGRATAAAGQSPSSVEAWGGAEPKQQGGAAVAGLFSAPARARGPQSALLISGKQKLMRGVLARAAERKKVCKCIFLAFNSVIFTVCGGACLALDGSPRERRYIVHDTC